MGAHGFDDNKNIVDFSTITSQIAALERKINNMYPVGSIYMSTRNTNPSSLFGGTWVAWGSGRVPIGVGGEYNQADLQGGTTGETVTANTGATTLTEAQMPSHKHKVEYYSSTDPDYVHHEVCGDWEDLASDETHYVMLSTSDMIEMDGKLHIKSGVKAAAGLVTETKGGNQAHSHTFSKNISHMQPYVTCYMWKRTA